jgi:hypothetical protein
MRPFKCIVFIILLHPFITFGQDTNNDSSQVGLKYSDLKYEIINIDTIVTHYINGVYNTPNFKSSDSTKIWADIILINLPIKVDSASLKRKVEGIMKDNGISKASIFRDTYSSMLFRLSSSYAAKKLKERDGYLGQFNID